MESIAIGQIAPPFILTLMGLGMLTIWMYYEDFKNK